MKFSDYLIKNKIILVDSAMGTTLMKKGHLKGEVPESLNIFNPDLIQSIHEENLTAGSDIICSNTFGANPIKMKNADLDYREIITKGLLIAERAIDKKSNKFVALDLGPIGRMLDPIGDLTENEAMDLFKEQIDIANGLNYDLILIETMFDIKEAEIAIKASKQFGKKVPVFCTITLEKSGRTLMGNTLKNAVDLFEPLGLDAFGVNCGFGPKDMIGFASELNSINKLPIIIQPNAGIPIVDSDGNISYPTSIEDFIIDMKNIIHNGASIIGGCCGTDYRYIAELRKLIDEQ